MYKNKLLIFLCVSFLFAFSHTVKAQNDLPENQLNKPAERGNLMRMLGLSVDQIRQIRQLNVSRKPLERDARKRLNDARQNLDKAVYADSLNESEVQMRIFDFQKAQADVIELKTSNELEIRKILTPEQLSKFRDLREQFKETRKENIQQRRNRVKNRQNRRENP